MDQIDTAHGDLPGQDRHVNQSDDVLLINHKIHHVALSDNLGRRTIALGFGDNGPITRQQNLALN